MVRRYSALLREAGFAAEDFGAVSRHSFPGSRALRERKAGISTEVTCASIGWTREMYDHCTQGRRLLTDAELVSLTSTGATEQPRAESQTGEGKRK